MSHPTRLGVWTSGGTAVLALVFVLSSSRLAFGVAGHLDGNFGSGGKVMTNFTRGWDAASSLALQPDGKIVVAGSAGDANPRFALARYLRDGTLDASFHGDGRVTTDLTKGSDGAADVAIQLDGQIVVAGVAGDPEGSDTKFALLRYNPDGTLDANFGKGGQVLTDFTAGFDVAAGLEIQTDGKIVAAGAATELGEEGQPPQTSGFAVARYNPDGTLDSSFGEGGKVITEFSAGLDQASDLALQVDGKIVAAGVAGAGGQGGVFAVARYNSDGGLDTSFSADGKRTTNFGSWFSAASSVAIQRNGRILVAGTEAIDVSAPDYKFALARFNPDGSLDDSFGGDGRVRTRFGGGVLGVAIQEDGKIVAVGGTKGRDQKFALARYTRRGGLDSSFAGDGKVVTNFTSGSDWAGAVALQPNGRILAGGRAGGLGGRFALARYLAA
jgi:uncharacterized delta-60 repeat protein